MLDEKGFDLWADGYDRSVGLSDEDGSYPFAGYKRLLNAIYNQVLAQPGRTVLDIGFGTGVLTAKLYQQGCDVWGQDFSRRMIALAQAKMPKAHLYHGDFSAGLVPELRARRYDAIIATYSLHHLTDEQKAELLRGLLPLLKADGHIYIGDIAFADRAALERCRRQSGEDWDEDEMYFAADEWTAAFPQFAFTAYSDCAGLLRI